MTKVFQKTAYVVSIYILLVHPAMTNNACVNHIKRIERLEGIPKNLLQAMARVESGRFNVKSKIVEPWPWTIQSEGKSYYFETRTEAARQIEELTKKGVTNIDVGCMQINIAHHGHHFHSAEQMLDPAKNIRYAAHFLKDLKNKGSKTWSRAVGNYHSATEVHHDRYKELVYKNIQKVTQDEHKKGLNQKKNPGGLYPVTVAPTETYASASLHPYTRTYGLNRSYSSKDRKREKLITPSARKRQALMKLKGIKSTEFMNLDK